MIDTSDLELIATAAVDQIPDRYSQPAARAQSERRGGSPAQALLEAEEETLLVEAALGDTDAASTLQALREAARTERQRIADLKVVGPALRELSRRYVNAGAVISKLREAGKQSVDIRTSLKNLNLRRKNLRAARRKIIAAMAVNTDIPDVWRRDLARHRASALTAIEALETTLSEHGALTAELAEIAREDKADLQIPDPLESMEA